MWRGLLLVLAVSITLVGAEQSALAKSEVVDDGGRFMLAVDGKKVFVKGVMWRPPASFDEDPAAFWKQSEEAIEAFFAVEAPLLKQAGVNTLRFGTTPPLQWVDALHERFGLYSMLAVHAAAADRDAIVDRYASSKGLLAWVVVGEPDDDAVIEGIKKRDDHHAVGLYNRKLARLTMPGAKVAGADFFVIPSLQGAHADAFERARTHLNKPLLLWSLTAAELRQWHEVYRNAALGEDGGTSLGAFSAEHGEGRAVLARVHSLDVVAADAAKVDRHFDEVFGGPAPSPDPEPTLAAPSPDPAPSVAKKKAPPRTSGKPNQVVVHKDAKGMWLTVDGRPFFVKGVNWTYIPIGKNYAYSLWNQSDAFIKEALDNEMALLKAGGFNAIRVFEDIPVRWVTYIYETFGIYSMVNHHMGRYGFTVNGVWRPVTDYSDPDTRKAIAASVRESAKKFANVPGVLVFLLGNENNYGLTWSSFEIEDLPDESARDDARAAYLYSFFGEMVDVVHAEDKHHPVAIANGDAQYLELMAKYLKGKLDIFGTNVYRGLSVRDMYQRVEEVLDLPVMFTEFGSDAYNAKEDREDHLGQAQYTKENWREMYEQARGMGGVGNSIGGFQFQWSDGWWKYKQTENLDVHDTNASWANAGYKYDFVAGQNNMNEEWFGICAKGEPDGDGHFKLMPRASYYVLQEAFELDPYAPGVTAAKIDEHFDAIEPYDYDVTYKRDLGAEKASIIERVRLTQLRMKFETYTTGGTGFDEPLPSERSQFSNETKFGHLESFFVEAEVQPVRRVTGKVAFNVVGGVPNNPMQEIFYEARGRRGGLSDDAGQDIDLSGLERVAVYRASFDWDESWFKLHGYYRTGHYHWIDEGDFFNIYGEANYGPWLDVYNGQAPFGAVFEGKKALEGLKIAAGPQLTWGANPAVIVKYTRDPTDWFRFTVMHQEEIAQQETTNTSAVIPQPLSRKSALSVRFKSDRYELKVGGIASGSNRIGQEFIAAREGTGVTYANSGYQFIADEIRPVDTLGAKARVQADWTPVKVYAQGGYKGLVADSGWDQMPNYAKWSLRESGRGNQYHALGGAIFMLSDFQIAPNFLFQKPLEGPLPLVPDFYAPGSNTFYPGVRPRDIRSSPFVVDENRETYGFEMILAYDPTPATWLWQWDNLRAEDAPATASLGFVYRIQPTARDSRIGFTADGNPLVFGTSPPAQNVWMVNAQSLLNLPARVRLLAKAYVGQQQGNAGGTEVLDRLILRGGGGVNMIWDQLQVLTELQFNDWGPYDYHRDFNITFPMQMYADVSYGVKTQEWLVDFFSRMGMSYRMRFLDEFSVPVATGTGDSYVWEVRSYINFGL
ncbi:MAG: hypothetical protein KC731_23750 [Myxococcales bacterium]|nr:hypothetical protein [Myxococcales bacterium]